MEGNPDGKILLDKWSKSPEIDIRYEPNATPDTFHQIENGLVFFMAFWSGPAIHSFVTLTEVLHQLRADSLVLVVVDVDGSKALEHFVEFKGLLASGSGQVAWVRSGKIVATTGHTPNAELLKENTLNLLLGPDWKNNLVLKPENTEWLFPWEPLKSSDTGFVRELRNELSAEHVLFGIPVTALAKRMDSDDVLFSTADPKKPFAVVHLTWRGSTELGSIWPTTMIFESWQDWTTRCMKADHKNLEN